MPHKRPKLLTPDSKWWEKCARHKNRQGTRFVAHMFLCERCANTLQRKALNNRPPIYSGLPVRGYCGLCNERKMTKLKQWFICPICLNVILAYTKGFAASRLIRKFWATKIKPKFRHLKLKETEVIRIEPFVAGRRSSKEKAESLTVLDLRCLIGGDPSRSRSSTSN